MGGLFKSPSPQVPAAPPPPPQRDDAAVQDAALKERQRRGRASGRRSTILSGQTGVVESDAAPAGRNTLLGE